MRAESLQPAERPDAWRTHLQDVFDSLGIPSGTVADNVAASVAVYCRQFHPRGVQRTELALLVARAFCVVGNQAAAERVLCSMRPHRLHVVRWLEILSELHRFPDLLPYFSCGVIRPADWAGARLDRMWTLDFSRLSLSDAERHEMMLYRSIRAIVETMGGFWDATAGEGVLGLKGLETVAVGTGPTVTDDVLNYIVGILLRQQEKRGWHAVPSLLKIG